MTNIMKNTWRVPLLVATCVACVTAAIIYIQKNRITADISTTTFSDSTRLSSSDEMLFNQFGLGNMSPYEPALMNFIRAHISKHSNSRRRQLSNEKVLDHSQAGQSKFVDELLNARRGGFFIECGAVDGESLSNSLYFEVARNWTGLLIEANPDYRRSLLEKNRHAYVLGACLSTSSRPTNVRMRPAGVLGGIVENLHETHLKFIGNFNKPDIQVNCRPFNSILAALPGDIRHVDYFSLDVEGPELQILKTVDWNKLFIEVLTVEYRIYGGGSIGIDRTATVKKLNELREFMNSTGLYKEVALLPRGSSDAEGLDVVFRRLPSQ